MRTTSPIPNAQVSKNRWLFSPATDIALFWGCMVIPGLILYFTNFKLEPQQLFFWVVLAGIPIDMGHVLGTFYPGTDRLCIKSINPTLNYVVIPLVILVSTCLIYYYSYQIFITSLAYLTLHHIISQQHGWISVCRFQSESKNSQWKVWDLVMLLNIMIPSVIFLHSPLCQVERSYFHINDLIFNVSSNTALISLTMHWLINGCYLYKLLIAAIRKENLNWPKINIFLSTWFLFYFGLVVFQNHGFFFASLALMHGTPYLLFSYRHTKSLENTRFPSFFSSLTLKKIMTFFRNPYCFGATCLIGAILWKLSQRHLWMPLIWVPLLTHYYIDSVIWRAKAFRSNNI